MTREAYKLCQKTDMNFIGYVEGHDLFHNRVEVVVCDGFVGNIVLKTLESFFKGLAGWLKTEITKNPKRKLGALLAKNAFRAIARRVDPDNTGGAPLLGLNGIVVKAHGSSRERAAMNAIRAATEAVQHHINDMIQAEAAKAAARLTENQT